MLSFLVAEIALKPCGRHVFVQLLYRLVVKEILLRYIVSPGRSRTQDERIIMQTRCPSGNCCSQQQSWPVGLVNKQSGRPQVATRRNQGPPQPKTKACRRHGTHIYRATPREEPWILTDTVQLHSIEGLNCCSQRLTFAKFHFMTVLGFGRSDNFQSDLIRSLGG